MSASVKKEKPVQSNTSVRTTLNEQLAKLQVKHNAEVDFLEDFKSFAKQRSTLEKEYAQGLQRLAQQYLAKREIKPPPDLADFPRTENRGLLEVWKKLLERTEEVAKSRVNVAEMLLTKISEEMRQQKRVKEQAFKKYIEVAQRMSQELQDSVKEMTTTKKSYNDQEKVTSDARQKFTEAETRLRKKDTKFFESVISLEKTHKKTSDRLKSCQKRLTVGRNDYLLAVATTNAHLHRHATLDLPDIMRSVDGEMYEKAKDAYMMYAQIEVDSAKVMKAEFEDLREQAYLVHRDYVLQCFLKKHSVLKDVIEFQFEPYGQDQVCALSREHGAEIFLDKDARKWATRLARDNNTISEKQKQAKGLQSVALAYIKNPEFGTSDAQAEAQQKMEELQEEIRRIEVLRVKTVARLDALREAGIDVSKWLQKASGEDKSGSQELLNVGYHDRQPSSLSLNSGSQEFDWAETASQRSTQLDDHLSEIISIGSSKSEAPPKFCFALYDYKSQRPDELDIHADEELEVLEWDDGDGWCKGRKRNGQEGYFPQNYVQPSSRSSSPPTHSLQPPPPSLNSNQSNGNVTMLRAMYEYTAQYMEELTFPEGALIELIRMDDNGVDDGWWEGRYQGKVGVFPSVVVETITNGMDHTSGLADITPINPMVPPPPDSPPPLPPDYPPPEISPDDLGIGSIGPTVVTVPDTSSALNSRNTSPSKFHPRNSSSPINIHTYSNIHSSPHTPTVTVEIPTPDLAYYEDGSRTWRADSFEDFDADESIV